MCVYTHYVCICEKCSYMNVFMMHTGKILSLLMPSAFIVTFYIIIFYIVAYTYMHLYLYVCVH